MQDTPCVWTNDLRDDGDEPVRNRVHDIVAPPRLWPDPIDPKRPGVLTREELGACKRILTLLASRSLQTLETVEWPLVDQRMLTALQVAGYVSIHETGRRRAFQWLTLEITERGRLYMQQSAAGVVS